MFNVFQCTSNVSFNCWYVILYFISQFGDFALAGYGTAIRYEQIFLLPVLALNICLLVKYP